MGAFYEVVLAPLLAKFGVAPKDPTYGRWQLPESQFEIDFEAQSHITTRRRRVFFKESNISSTRLKGFSKTHIEAPPAVGNASQLEYIEVQEGEDITLTPAELARGRGRDWIVYKTYENNSPEAQSGKGHGCDIVCSHGKPYN